MPKHPDLTAYVLGELHDDQIEAHLRDCTQCQKELVELHQVSAKLQNPPIQNAPSEIWERIGVGSKPSVQRYPRMAVVGLAVVILLGFVLFWRPEPAGRPFSVETLSGSPRLDGQQVGLSSLLVQGGALETDATSSARIKLTGLGDVDLLPGSRLRLLKSNPKSCRFALDSGTLRATVTAPPRLFIVDTPSASAVDLGCAYELTVLPGGESVLRVTAGWVVLESKAGAAYVRSGMQCKSDSAGKLQTPVYEDAPQACKEAVSEFDKTRKELDVVLATARPKDAITLWHLLRIDDPSKRSAVYDRLAQFAPPPVGVTRAGVLALDEKMLNKWREEMAPVNDIDFWK